jgi:hypothetical protein
MNTLHKSRTLQRGNPSRTPPNLAGVASRLFAYLIILVLLAACAEKRLLTNSFASVEDIGKKMLEALHSEDITSLEALAISEEEYRSFVWPHSPVYGIREWQDHYDFVWKQHQRRSIYSLRQMLSKYGGKKFTLVRVRFGGETTDHTIYQAHRDTRLVVINDEGKEVELKLFGSIMEMDGQFKIMSYKTN